MFNVFLWGAAKPRISLSRLQQPKEAGGLKLADIEIKDKSLKVSWIKTIATDTLHMHVLTEIWMN